MRILKKGNNK